MQPTLQLTSYTKMQPLPPSYCFPNQSFVVKWPTVLVNSYLLDGNICIMLDTYKEDYFGNNRIQDYGLCLQHSSRNYIHRIFESLLVYIWLCWLHRIFFSSSIVFWHQKPPSWLFYCNVTQNFYPKPKSVGKNEVSLIWFFYQKNSSSIELC